MLSGEALLIVDGEERPLRRWDFFHCPPGTEHIIVGAGDGPCVVLAVGSREHQRGENWGAYTVDETALPHGVGVEEETTDRAEAYARAPKAEWTSCQEGGFPASRLHVHRMHVRLGPPSRTRLWLSRSLGYGLDRRVQPPR